MKRSKLLLFALFGILFGAIIITGSLYSQTSQIPDLSLTGTHRILNLSNESGFQMLVAELLIEDFEDAGEWSSFMPRDYGLTMAMRREGRPLDAETQDIDNNYVLGIKTEFMRRDFSWITITPAKPNAIKGNTKQINVWVAGRAYLHELSIVLRDYVGELKVLYVDQLTHVGWKQLQIPIPDTIDQENYKVTDERGLTFEGFRIDFEPEDILGRPFYVYFDWMTSETDIFNEAHGNQDDMMDNW